MQAMLEPLNGSLLAWLINSFASGLTHLLSWELAFLEWLVPSFLDAYVIGVETWLYSEGVQQTARLFLAIYSPITFGTLIRGMTRKSFFVAILGSAGVTLASMLMPAPNLANVPTLIWLLLPFVLFIIYELYQRMAFQRRLPGAVLSNLSKHVLMVDADGTALELKPSYSWRYWLWLVPKFERVSPSNLDAYLQTRLERLDEQPVTIFIHGGLNDYRPNLKLAQKRLVAMQADGVYPIFILWRSGLLPSYGEHIFDLREGHKLFKQFLKVWTVPAKFVADIGRGVARTFITWYYQFITDMKPLIPWFNPAEHAYKRLYPVLRERAQEAGNIRLSIGLDSRTTSTLVQVGRVLHYINPWTLTTSYAVWPFIDAFGKSAWEVMLRRTRTLFRTPDEFGVANRRNTSYAPRVPPDSKAESEEARSLDSLPTGTLYLFAERLQSEVKTPLTLTGHSMGTIVLNRWLEHFPEFPTTNIVYMAAASSLRDSVSALVPHLKRRPNTQFYNLSLHPRSEQGEYHFGDFSPRGGLLEWIDSYFSIPSTFDGRTLGKWENVLLATHLFPPDVRGQIHLKAFGAGPLTKGPKKHGDFGKRAFWREDFWKTGAVAEENLGD